MSLTITQENMLELMPQFFQLLREKKKVYVETDDEWTSHSFEQEDGPVPIQEVIEYLQKLEKEDG